MIYRLLRDDGSIECDGDARDDDHALVVFGGRLNKTLAFDGPNGPTYLLQSVEANKVLVGARDGRAVYVTGYSSN